MRKFARTDSNHTAIVKALRQAGCSVLSLASLGHGVPDLVVARCGKTVLMEIKDGAKKPSEQRLTEDEVLFQSNWKARIYIVHHPVEAMEAMNL